VQDGRWIMLTRKLPTLVSPPKMSIHFSYPWPMENSNATKNKPKYDSDYAWASQSWVREHDYGGARKIMFRGEAIRVFPDEYSYVTNERLEEYLQKSHVLIQEDGWGVVDTSFKDKEEKTIFEAALLDGASDYQALATLYATKIDDIPCLPPVGWLRIKEEYGLLFCTERELSITDSEIFLLKTIDIT